MADPRRNQNHSGLCNDLALLHRGQPHGSYLRTKRRDQVETAISLASDSGRELPRAGPWEPFNTIQAIAKGFVDEMEGDPQITLISYSTAARLDVALTNNRGLVKKAMVDLKPGGYTDIASSVNDAIDELLRASGPEPKLVIPLTDGRTNTVKGRYVGDGNSQAVNALLNSSKAAKDKGIVIQHQLWKGCR